MGKNNFLFFPLLFFLFFFSIFFISFSCGGSKSNPNSDPNFKILEFGPQGENVSADASIFVRFSNKATDFSFSITPYVKLTPYWYDESNTLKLVSDGGLELSTKYSVYVEGKSVKSNSRASVMWEFKTAARPQGSQAGPQISIQSGCFKDKLIFNISSTSTISFSVYVNSNLVKKDTLGYGSKDVQIEEGFTEGKNDLAVEIINLVDGSRIKYTFEVTKDTVPPKEPEIIKISRAEFSIKEPEDSGCGVDHYNLYEIIEGNQVLLGGVVAEKNFFDTYFMAFQKSKICITAVDKAYNESGCSNVEEQGFEKLSIKFGAPVSYPVIKDKKLFFISDGKLFIYDGQAPKETGFSCNKIFGLPDGNIACESQGEVFVISETSSKKLYSGQLMATCERDFAVSDGKSVRIYNANFEINKEINIEGVESLECADIDKDGEIELIMGIPKEDKIYMERLDFKNLIGRSDTISAGEGNLIIINKGSKFGSFIESIEKPEPKIFVLAPEWDLNYAYRKIAEAEGEKPSETNVDFGTGSLIFVISPFNQNQIYDLIYTNIKGARKFRLFEDKFILWLTNSGLIVDFHISKRFSQIKLLENVLDIAIGDVDGDGNKDIIATTENSIEIFK